MLSLNVRLGAMMFLEYIIWGSWYVTLSTYLTTTLGFTGTQAGMVFGTVSVASMVSPFFVGMVADRYFSTERVMAVLYLIGAVLAYAVTQVTSFGAVYATLLLYGLAYFPTIALTNSIIMQNVKDAGRDFPVIRMLGTIGWIVAGLVVGSLKVETTSTPFLIASGVSVLMAIYSLAALPHTPPPAKGKAVSLRGVLGLDALAMLKQRAFLVFVIASLLACIPLTFYYSFTNTYLNGIGVENAAGKMTLGQASEVIMMLLMPFIFRRVSVKGVLLLGLFAWAARYLLLAYGDAGPGVWMLYMAIILHGICYDFFFVTGQLYTDQEAPSHLRSTAQGFIIFVTYGVGMLAGSLLSGSAVDFFTSAGPAGPVRNWTGFWMSSSAMAAVIFLMVVLFFNSRAKIQAKESGA